MAKAEELAKKADEETKEPKPLPALVSPTVNLIPEIRQAVAIRCRDTGESFSIVTNKMWLDLLKREKRVKADLSPDFTRVRVGGGLKAKLEEKDGEIAALKAEIERLKASKR